MVHVLPVVGLYSEFGSGQGLTQAATLAISDFGLRIERRPSILDIRWRRRLGRNEIISIQAPSILNPKSTIRNRADFRRDAGGFVAEVDFARHG
jgi:hypothetical protein